MTVDSSLIQKAADALHNAAQTGTSCGPVRDILGTSTDIATAYAVQTVNHQRALTAGRRVSGRKIGLTAKVVQEQLGVDQPDYGMLYNDMCVADGQELDSARLMAPRAEGEIALVLEQDLDNGVHNVVDLINATAYILPSIEIVDSRVGWDLTIVDTVADNASAGLYVVGSRPVQLHDLDVREVPMSVVVDGEEKASGVGSACLGNPLEAGVWLANAMAAVGEPLRAGECIMTGALGPMVGIESGNEVTIDFGPLGSVTTAVS